MWMIRDYGGLGQRSLSPSFSSAVQQFFQNSNGSFFTTLANFSDRSNARGTALIAAAGPQHFQRARQEFRSQLEQRLALADSSRVGVEQKQIRLEALRSFRNVLGERDSKVSGIAH